MSAISWADHAKSINRRALAPCGETTAIQIEIGLLDVSDSYNWVTDKGGDIKLTIEVYDDPDQPPLASRIGIIKRSY